jgi:hypothetical protein
LTEATYFLGFLTIGFNLAIAFILVRKFIRTRDAGFLWLGVATLIWPRISGLLESRELTSLRSIGSGQSVGFPFSLVGRGEISVGGLFTFLKLLQLFVGAALLLVAVMYLYKAKADRNAQLSSLIAPNG